MYCSRCGKQMEGGARFCSACGTAYEASPFARAAGQGQLMRPRYPRAIGGVCSGIALYYGWDIVLVRLAWVLCVLFGGTGILAYAIAWVIIPEAPYALPSAATTGVSG